MNAYNEEALKQMVQTIIDDGKKKSDLKLRQEKDEIVAVSEQSIQDVMDKTKHKEEVMKKKHEETLLQKEMEYDRMFHAELMKEKKKYQEKLFDRLKESLDTHLSSKLQDVVRELVHTLGDEEMEIQIGEYSKDVLNEDFIKTLPKNVSLSSEFKKNDGGFLINRGGVLYNAFYSTYLEDSMDKYGPKFVSELSEYVE